MALHQFVQTPERIGLEIYHFHPCHRARRIAVDVQAVDHPAEPAAIELFICHHVLLPKCIAAAVCLADPPSTVSLAGG